MQRALLKFSAKRLMAASAAVLALCTTVNAVAADKVTLLTSWFAEAEFGGFYQAVAKGIYKKYGLDVTIKSGGPQVNGMQLLVSGGADYLIGYDLQTLKGVEQGLPVVAIGTTFQRDLEGLMSHDDVKSLDQLKNKTILLGTSSHSTWWPWLKEKYGLSDAQTRPYTFNLQPFFADPNIVQQGFVSSEPYQAMKAGKKAIFHLFSDYGYPTYAGLIVTTRNTIQTRPDVTRRFLKASMEGWKSYMEGDAAGNAAADAMIKHDSSSETDEQIAYTVAKFKELKVVTGGDAATKGIGVITEDRFRKTRDFMVSAKLLSPDTDWKKAIDTRFIDEAKVLP